MRTDTIFYQLFLTFHSLLFELLGQPLENANDYQFTSAEIKEKSFRFDGIFMPSREDKPIYFVEVQFQNKPDFYWELIAEINIYLNQYKPLQDWKAVALFAQRSFEVESLTTYQQELINNGRIVIPNKTNTIRTAKILTIQQFLIKRTTKKLSQRLKVETTMLEPIKSIFISNGIDRISNSNRFVKSLDCSSRATAHIS